MWMFRLSPPVQSLLVCQAFLLVAFAVVDHYGIGPDEYPQRVGAAKNLAFITGAADRLDGFPEEHDKYYGVAFQLPLLLLERGVGLEDSRRIYLLRHLVMHAFFLVGGWCCSLLVYRLTRSRGVALFALLVFVLQPRLYAHSFFNPKDLPFLSMFMVTLYGTHRAFRRDTVGAFMLCGVCVGVLTNLRPMGVMLYPAVLALRGLDLGQAGRGERTHVVATGTVFALAGPCTLYALSPYLWTNPFAFVTAWETLAYHPVSLTMLFQGQLVHAHNLPPSYFPTYMAITITPVTLLCGVLGVLWLCIDSVRRPWEAIKNTDLRFGWLLLACLTSPILAVIVLGSHSYNGWIHFFFLSAPLCCLAGRGLWWAGGMRRQAAVIVYALAYSGVVVTGWEMVRLHPLQYVYFNRLAGRTAPEYLQNHYELDPFLLSCKEGLRFLRRQYPATTVYVKEHRAVNRAWLTLSRADRERLVLVRDDKDPEVEILCGRQIRRKMRRKKGMLENAMYVRRVYNSTLVTVTARVMVPEKNRDILMINSFEDAVSGRLLSKQAFDVYTYPGSLTLGYVRRACTLPDTLHPFFVHVVPVDEQDLPTYRRRYGFENLDFPFYFMGRRSEGQCWATVTLPDYEILYVRTGQYTGGTRAGRMMKIWEPELVFPIP